MIDLLGVQGPNDANIIRNAADMRKNLGNLLPGFSPFFEFTKGPESFKGGVL